MFAVPIVIIKQTMISNFENIMASVRVKVPRLHNFIMTVGSDLPIFFNINTNSYVKQKKCFI